MAQTKYSFGIQALIAAAVTIGIVVFVNLIAARGLVRYDLTADKRFSVSEPTQRILRGLRESVKVTAYLSEKMPVGFETLRRDLIDKFKEFAVLSNGNFEYRFVDPGNDEKMIQELANRGIRQLQGQVMQRDEFTVVNFFSSLEVSYFDKEPEVIPVVQNVDDLEYDLVSRIVRLSSSKKPIVAFYYSGIEDADNPEKRKNLPQELRSEYDLFVRYLRELFDVREVQLAEHSRLPKDCRCLIVCKPESLKPRQVFEINRAASMGIPVLLLVSKFDAPYNPQTGAIRQIDTGLESLLREWGITFGDSILSDRNCGNITIVQRTGFFNIERPVGLPTLAMIFEGLNRDSIISRSVPRPGVLVPWPAAINVDEEKLKQAGLTKTKLLETSAYTWKTPFSPSLNDDMLKIPTDQSKFAGAQLVGLMLKGPVPFTFQGQEVPPWPPSTDQDRPPVSAEDQIEDVTGTADLTPVSDGTVLVVSSGDMLNWQYLRQEDNRGSAFFLANAVEVFALGQDLINIRARNFASRPIAPDVSTGFFKILNIALMPLAVILFGVGRWWWRTTIRNNYLRQTRA